MSEAPTTTEKHTAVDKALILLKQVGSLSSQSEVRMSDLIKLTGFQRPTIHRLLTTLKEHGFIDKVGNTYRLGAKVMALSAEAYGSLDVRKLAQPFMRDLSDKTQLTIHLAIVDEHEVVYIDKIESRQLIVLASGIGWRGALHSTALGKVMMAFDEGVMRAAALRAGLARKTEFTLTQPAELDAELQKVRSLGYAVDDRENQIGIRCVGAAIRNYAGEPVAGISVSGTVEQLTSERVAQIGTWLEQATLAISQQLGFAKSGQ